MVVNNTVKRNEGCPCDKIQISSVQAFVIDERGELNYSKYSPISVEHGESDIIIKAGTHEVIKDNNGNVVERRTVKAKESEDLIH